MPESGFRTPAGEEGATWAPAGRGRGLHLLPKVARACLNCRYFADHRTGLGLGLEEGVGGGKHHLGSDRERGGLDADLNFSPGPPATSQIPLCYLRVSLMPFFPQEVPLCLRSLCSPSQPAFPLWRRLALRELVFPRDRKALPPFPEEQDSESTAFFTLS